MSFQFQCSIFAIALSFFLIYIKKIIWFKNYCRCFASIVILPKLFETRKLFREVTSLDSEEYRPLLWQHVLPKIGTPRSQTQVPRSHSNVPYSLKKLDEFLVLSIISFISSRFHFMINKCFN